MNWFYLAIICSSIVYAAYPLTLILYEWIAQRNLYRHLKQFRDNREDCFRGRRISSIEYGRIWLQNDGIGKFVHTAQCRFYRITEKGREKIKVIRRLRLKEFREGSEGLGIAMFGDSGESGSTRYLVLNSSADYPESREIMDALQRGNYFQSPGLNRSFYFGAALNILFLSFSILKGIPEGYILLQITLTMVPLLPLLPPGVFLYLLSFNLWRRDSYLFRFLSLLTFFIMLLTNSILIFNLIQKLMYP